ncbi:MAG: GIY-YIG nuclease family protein [Cyclobacteriaceae bacterium]|nr:GIY-YIG nuclease family protein [Cyclobacteriaceae bacterium]
MNRFTVYIIYSAKLDKYYIGYTSGEIEDRLRRHNGTNRNFTGKANDWEVKYLEEFDDKGKALKREKELKSLKSRKLIEEMITNFSDTRK